MKVALLSFHNALNYGAALQAYALQTVLRSNGIDCEYINYVNGRRKSAYNIWAQAKTEFAKKNYSRVLKLIVGAPLLSLRRKKFSQFYRQNLRVTDELYTCAEEARSLNSVYDLFIVGSDQVWNIDNNGGDMAFLLDFVDNSERKISYSSSFGMYDIPDEYIEKYRTCLSNIKYLSTRENAGVRLIKKICGRDAKLVLDPVFLLSAEQWKPIISKKHNKKKYVFYYTNESKQMNVANTLISSKKELHNRHVLSTHLGIGDFFNKSISVKSWISPSDFLMEINNAELIVTASFHCLAFAIILQKPFIALLSGEQGKDERLINLLEITGLMNHIYSEHMKVEDVVQSINYDDVSERLKPYIRESKAFLETSINNVIM